MSTRPEKSAENFLKEVLLIMKKAHRYLETSFKKVENISIKDDYSSNEIEMVEVFTARFSRLTDLLLKKAYRTLDNYELLEPGTLIDTVHRAEKRGIVSSLDQIRALKDLRNMIAHEYAGENFKTLLMKTKQLAPELLVLASKYENYCEKYLKGI